MVSAWVVLAAKKELTLCGAPGHGHLEAAVVRAQELEAQLQEVLSPLIGTTPLAERAGVVVQARDGGILAAFGGDAEECCSAAHGDRICVFQGTLRNRPQLLAKLAVRSAKAAAAAHSGSSRSGSESGDASSSKDGHPPPAAPQTSVPLPTADEIHGLNAAGVILHLYDLMGSPMLAQLVGRFSFCMYDAKQVRVLAARDGSGAIPLLQARTSKGSMMLASNPALLTTCCRDVVHFEPGWFKYGWNADPRLFTAADAAPPHAQACVRRSMEQRRSMDASAGGVGSPGASRRRSSDHHGPHTPGAGGNRRSVDHSSPRGSGARPIAPVPLQSRASVGHPGVPSSPIAVPSGVSPRQKGGITPRGSAGGLASRMSAPLSAPGPVAARPAACAASTLPSAVAHLNINAPAFVPHT